MNKKKDLGQFFTTNSDYILQGFEKYIVGKTALDPFAGNGDLLNWAERHGAKAISGLDIDSKLVNNKINYNDSLISIPKAQFNITNPPYLGRHNMSPQQKEKYPMGEYGDLYLLSIKRIIESDPDEGILIIPVNFFSAENSDDIRTDFLNRFQIDKVNYFKDPVFEDTTCNVVSFYYRKKLIASSQQKIEFITFPGCKRGIYTLEAEYNYKIAGKEINKLLTAPPLVITRLRESHIADNPGAEKISALFNNKNSVKEYLVSTSFKSILSNNILLISATDASSLEEDSIKIEDVRKSGHLCLVGKDSSRNNAYVILPEVSLEDQENIISLFNDTLNSMRKKYDSLFLTNFRENNRKRVSFEFCYKLIAHCYQQLKDQND